MNKRKDLYKNEKVNKYSEIVWNIELCKLVYES